MFRVFHSLGKGGAFLFVALLTASPAAAQPSALGHAAARGYRPVYSADTSTLRVYPGDKGFHSTMQIQRYYQVLNRARSSASLPSVAPPRFTAAETAPAAPNVVVSISEPANKPVMVAIRGPDGKVRSFAVAGGREAIQPRVIVLRPGEKLTLQFQSAQVQLPKKP